MTNYSRALLLMLAFAACSFHLYEAQVDLDKTREWNILKTLNSNKFDQFSPNETEKALFNFAKNMKTIAYHNENFKKGLVKYSLDINKYSYLSYPEFATINLKRKKIPDEPFKGVEFYKSVSIDDKPTPTKQGLADPEPTKLTDQVQADVSVALKNMNVMKRLKPAIVSPRASGRLDTKTESEASIVPITSTKKSTTKSVASGVSKKPLQPQAEVSLKNSNDTPTDSTIIEKLKQTTAQASPTPSPKLNEAEPSVIGELKNEPPGSAQLREALIKKIQLMPYMDVEALMKVFEDHLATTANASKPISDTAASTGAPMASSLASTTQLPQTFSSTIPEPQITESEPSSLPVAPSRGPVAPSRLPVAPTKSTESSPATTQGPVPSQPVPLSPQDVTFSDASSSTTLTTAKTTAQVSSQTKSPLPEKVDWAALGYVGEIRDQGKCGACYAFAALGSLQSAYAILNNMPNDVPDLSEQQIIDCTYPNAGDPFDETSNWGNMGCQGGFFVNTFVYAKDRGIMSEKSYNYVSKSSNESHGYVQECKYDDTAVAVKPKRVFMIDSFDEKSMKEVVAKQPIAASISAIPDFVHYRSGIFTGEKCDTSNCKNTLNHDLLIVGYGTEDGLDYWLVKNSWGKSWGMNGYGKVLRNNNTCCIAFYSGYATF